MAHVLPTAQAFAQAATGCEIQSQDGLVRFELNAEQTRISDVILTKGHDHVIVLKSRQIGTSTYFCLLDLLFALLNPRSRVGIVVDLHSKAKDLLGRVKKMAGDLGIEVNASSATHLVLFNGSEIVAITARSDEPGRSGSFQALHITELPYWPSQEAFDTLLDASHGAAVWIETTAKGTGDLFYELWTKSPQYEKIFFSVEDHAAYAEDPTSITDTEWKRAQDDWHFTSRPHAAWWINYQRAKGRGFDGTDLVLLQHEYPVVEAHSFLIYDGRYILTNPKVSPHQQTNGLKIFQPRLDRHRYVVAVDTSGGVGRDGNAVVVLDRSTKQLCASWKDVWATIPQVVEKTKQARALFNADHVIVETNGVGRGTLQLCKQGGLSVYEFDQNAGTKSLCIQYARRAIEDGIVYGPKELLDECQSLHIVTRKKSNGQEDISKRGDFRGDKDLIMSIGMALLDIERNPHIIPVPPNQNIFDPDAWEGRKPAFGVYI